MRPCSNGGMAVHVHVHVRAGATLATSGDCLSWSRLLVSVTISIKPERGPVERMWYGRSQSGAGIASCRKRIAWAHREGCGVGQKGLRPGHAGFWPGAHGLQATAGGTSAGRREAAATSAKPRGNLG